MPELPDIPEVIDPSDIGEPAIEDPDVEAPDVDGFDIERPDWSVGGVAYPLSAGWLVEDDGIGLPWVEVPELS